MKKSVSWFYFIPSCLLILFNSFNADGQSAPVKQWDITFGGVFQDHMYDFQQTKDGGYILGGTIGSYQSGDISNLSLWHGDFDFWIVKTDSLGNKLWDKAYGSYQFDEFVGLELLPDGSIMLAGHSNSMKAGEKSQDPVGIEDDFWLLKLDSSGNKLWDKRYGGSGQEHLTDFHLTNDGGFILGGWSRSEIISGDKTEGTKGRADFWVVKTDASGDLQWEKTYGGSENDYLESLQQTSDGGFIFGGRSYSGISGDKSSPLRGGIDFWVIKTDGAGNLQWDKTYGGNNFDFMQSLIQTADCGFLLGGWSNSGQNGERTAPSFGSEDFWVVKIDNLGNKLWDKAYGGNGNDRIFSIQETEDSEILLGGSSNSGFSGNKTQFPRGFHDFWIVKTDASGNLLWDKAVGGHSDDWLYKVNYSTDGSILLGGSSESNPGFEKTQLYRGDHDYWLVKLKGPAIVKNKNKAPTIVTSLSNSNTISVSVPANNALNFNVLSADVDNDMLWVKMVGQGFDPDSLGMVFGPESGVGSINSKFSWFPGCWPEGNSYTLQFIVTDRRCAPGQSDTVYVTIKVEDRTSKKPVFTLPNVFTPNGDGLNETFTLPQAAQASCYDALNGSFKDVKIFNRWGVQVFQSTDRNFAWDGKNVNDGTYFYLVSFQKKKYKGFVEIVR